MSAQSSLAGDSNNPLLVLITQTALWVGKLKRDRAKEPIARALAGIGHAHPQISLMLESHFKGFCINTAPSVVNGIWAAAVANLNVDSVHDELVLRQMYWEDNPEEMLLETTSYEHMKNRLEHVMGYWKNKAPVGYVRVDPVTGEINILCQSKMRDLMCDIHYSTRTMAPDGTPRIERTPMGPRWLADDTKRNYERMVVDPTMSHKADEYNLWCGFAAEKDPPIAADEVLDKVQLMLDHILHVLAAGVPEHADYILDWMSFLVQKPERRTCVLLLFYGQQGAGKGILWDFLREKVLGHKVSTQTANAKADLFDRFSNGFLYKRLIQLDEAQDIRQYEDDIKNKLTARDLRYEKKNQDTITVPNFSNFVVTTNNMVTLRVSHDDRRLVFFKCSDARKNDLAYFAALGKAMAQPGAGRALYQFFMARNLTRYTNEMDFQNTRPITAFYMEMRSESLKAEQLYFSALANAFTTTHKFAATELYKSYKAFAVEYAEVSAYGAPSSSRVLHCTTFGKQLPRLSPGIVPAHGLHGNKMYTVDPTALRELLQKANMFDADSNLKEPPRPHNVT